MGDAGRPYSGSQWLGRHFGGGARGGGLELEFRLEFDSSDGFEFGVEGLGWKSFMEFLDVYLAGYIKDKDELTDAIKKSMV